jgi:DNA-binding PucR family transcriptional regulator
VEPAGLVVAADRGEPDAAWLGRVRSATGERRAVLGPVVEPAQAHRSAALAQAAWPLHASGRLDADANLVRADEHLLALLLAATPEVAEALSGRALAPLRSLPAGAATRAEETLRAWLDAHGDVTATAAALHVHPQTVRYRLAGLRETFNGALDEPAARLEIAVALRAGAACDRPT